MKMDEARRLRFGLALRVEREETELTQAALGARVGATGSAVGQWEAGLTLPDGPEEVFALERALRVPAGRLSHHLDFTPAGPPASDSVGALEADPALEPEEREQLLALYRWSVARSRQRREGGG